MVLTSSLSTSCFLPPTNFRASRRSGFTLIEMLIVVAISAMLSAVAIGYSSVGRNEISLSVEAAKISELILQAKSLSIATYGDSSGSCGYGVVFNEAAQTYSIFSYHPAASPPCPSENSIVNIAPGEIQKYTDGTWNIHVANGVALYPGTSGDSLSLVLFYPPDPDTILSHDGFTFLAIPQTLNVYLKTADGAATATISVSPAGQVEF